MLACVASVPVRGERNSGRTKESSIGPEQNGGRKGVGKGKEGNACPQTPRISKTPTGFHGWVHLLIDNFVTELKSQ